MIIHWYTLDDFTADFLAVRDNFSREGLGLLFEFYDSIGEPIEFDPVAMCCEWSEHSSAEAAIFDYYGGDLDHAQDMTELYAIRRQQRGESPAEALESVLGVPVLWDGESCFLVGV